MARAQESAAAISSRGVGAVARAILPDSHRQAVELPQARARAFECLEQPRLLRRELDESYDQDRRRFCADDCGLRRNGIARLRDVQHAEPARSCQIRIGPGGKQRRVLLVALLSPATPAFSACAPGVDVRPCVGGECSGTAHVGERRSRVFDDTLPQRDCLRARSIASAVRQRSRARESFPRALPATPRTAGLPASARRAVRWPQVPRRTRHAAVGRDGDWG